MSDTRSLFFPLVYTSASDTKNVQNASFRESIYNEGGVDIATGQWVPSGFMILSCISTCCVSLQVYQPFDWHTIPEICSKEIP